MSRCLNLNKMNASSFIVFSVFLCLNCTISFASNQRNPFIPGLSKPTIRGEGSNGLYPISGAWFKDRFSLEEWNKTLTNFTSIGGDTVILRAPSLVMRTPFDIKTDPDFHWCTNYDKPRGHDHCVTEAVRDLTEAGFVIDHMATYTYEEDFNFNIMICNRFERRIVSSRVYYRLVLPVNDTYGINPCNLQKGDHVVVVFTMFSGVDPHDLLLRAAKPLGVSVYFGLPGAPRMPSGTIWEQYLPAYYGFVQRVLTVHKLKYKFGWNNTDYTTLHFSKYKKAMVKQQNVTLYDAVEGYYGADEACLATDLVQNSLYMSMYKNLGSVLREVKKKFMLSPYIITNKSFGHYTLEEHVAGFELLAMSKLVDVIAVQEGRGAGKGCYYWDTEEKMKIADRDPVLYDVVRYIDPNVTANVTFHQQFTTSVNKLFMAFGAIRDQLHENKTGFDLWLNVEAFEYLMNDPCLPVDSAGSGMSEILNRADKSRVDWAVANAGFFPQKIISFAWDADFTCTTQSHRSSLAAEILQESSQWNSMPIISFCSYHSRQNMSVVIIGYNMLGLTQEFEVTYQTREGNTKTASLYAYYVELDYGSAHGRSAALMYIQLYDVMDPYDIALNGWLRVQAKGAHTYCISTYDFT